MEYNEEEVLRYFEFNEFQTQFHSLKQLKDIIKVELDRQDLEEKYIDEVQSEFLLAYDSIEFMKNISDHKRLRAKDLKRFGSPNYKSRTETPDGRIRPDITNPHILEDMDFFREAALTFQKTGSYTNLYPNPAPYSDYTLHWKREAHRCRYGMTRPSDGEWIPGYLYFYWNYSTIQKVIKENGRADRTTDFPNPYDGDYLFYHYLQRARDTGKHTATLKKRGCGFSFKGGSKLARNFILGEYDNSRTKTKSYAVADSTEYLTKDGILNKFLDIVDFCAEFTPFPSSRELKDSLNSMEWKMGYRDPKTNKPSGVKNEVIGVTLKNDPHRARGKRGVLFEWEEVGSFGNFLTAWGIARPSVEEDGEVFGLMNAYGTGGEAGADFEGLEEIFYRPKGYNIAELPNVFDKNVNGLSKCAFFFPQYMNVNGKYDKDGNSDVLGALIQIIASRINIKYNTSDPNAIVQEKAERPITPQEAIMRKEGSAFPIASLKEYLEEIKPDIDKFFSEHYVGELEYKGADVIWKSNTNLNPIRKFPYKGKDAQEGCIEIFEMPKRSKRTGDVFSNRYIAGTDPVDNDYTASGSLASIFIFDLWTDRIVAEYTGRPILASEYYDKCILLLKFFNAKMNYENNLKGLFGHFSSKNVVYLLTDTLQYLRDQEIVKATLHGNRAKGTRTNTETIKLGKTLQRGWQLEQRETEVIDDSGKIVTIYKANYKNIRSIAYIEECIAWNPDGNFDRVSAMDMVMLLREDIKSNVEFYKENDKPVNKNKLDNDEFIDSNWQQHVADNGYPQDI